MSDTHRPRISESEALIAIIQVYLSHTSKWYSSLIASLLSVIALPIIALNITVTINNPSAFDFLERSAFSLITLSLSLISVYLISKVNYSLALLDQLYESLEIKYTQTNLRQYIIQRKSNLLSEIKPFKMLYRFQKDTENSLAINTYLPLSIAFMAGLFLLLLIWWKHGDCIYGVLMFGLLYGLFLCLLFRQKVIM